MDRKRWVDTMLTEEMGLQLDGPIPSKAASMTFVSFLIAGLIPILPFILQLPMSAHGLMITSSLATLLSFFLIGLLKGAILERPRLRSALETLFIGSCAATLAYLVGRWLKEFSIM
jgi:VIT1/CCC1 family predicted Fe2+/Mn2+ transporter